MAKDLIGKAGGQSLIGVTVLIAACPLIALIRAPFCGGETLMRSSTSSANPNQV